MIATPAPGMGDGPEIRRIALRQLEQQWIDKQMKKFPEGTHVTCEGCLEVHCCEFAFDPYNTNGDCLALK